MRTSHSRLQADWIARCMAAAVIITLCARSVSSQETRGLSISVQVLDQQGAVIVGARTALTDAAGHETSGITNQEGKVAFSNLTLGGYAMRITAEHFRMYEETHIQVTPEREMNLTVKLSIAGVEESIAVFPDTSVAQFAEYVGGSLVIRGDALLALDGPGGLESLLRALTLRTSGPFGPVALVDGFADAQLPPTYSIREIRINDNPFSAEYATLGLGRIEILTKPGTETLHGSAYGSLGDDNWNSEILSLPIKSAINRECTAAILAVRSGPSGLLSSSISTGNKSTPMRSSMPLSWTPRSESSPCSRLLSHLNYERPFRQDWTTRWAGITLGS